jgi:hypothetical protein
MSNELVDYKKLTQEQRVEVNKQLDNFFEALFFSPLSFEPQVIRYLAVREKELTIARYIGWTVGGSLTGLGYFLYKKSNGFYFKNCVRMFIYSFLGAYAVGRFFEYKFNEKKFRPTLLRIAMEYNITDDEIREMHTKANEIVLKEKQKEEQRKFSLDKVKIKF